MAKRKTAAEKRAARAETQSAPASGRISHHRKENARAGYLRAHFAAAGRQLTDRATLQDLIDVASVHGGAPAAKEEPARSENTPE